MVGCGASCKEISCLANGMPGPIPHVFLVLIRACVDVGKGYWWVLAGGRGGAVVNRRQHSLSTYPGSNTVSCSGSCAICHTFALVNACTNTSLGYGISLASKDFMPFASTRTPPLPAMLDCPANINKYISNEDAVLCNNLRVTFILVYSQDHTTRW